MSPRPLVEPGPPLTPDERRRFSRHLLLPQLGETGQRRLRAARVCVVGAGGLGAPVLQYLGAAGVGALGVVDDDVVEVSNLQRQVVHGVADVGARKTVSAARAVHAIDPDVEVVLHDVRLDAASVGVLAGYDLVIDGTDNFATRYLVNDACADLGLPLLWASVLRFDAQVSAFWARPPAGSGVDPVELRDLYPEPPPPGEVPSCAEAGVLGALCGQVGSVLATEAVKLLTGVGRPLFGRVLVLDALEQRWAEVPLRGDPQRARAARARSDARASEACARALPGDVAELEPTELAALLSERDDVVLVDVREDHERAQASIAGSLHVPLGAVLDGTGLAAIPRETRVVLHCRSGVRSRQAGLALLDAGYADVAHLRGGILAWAADVDPGLVP